MPEWQRGARPGRGRAVVQLVLPNTRDLPVDQLASKIQRPRICGAGAEILLLSANEQEREDLETYRFPRIEGSQWREEANRLGCQEARGERSDAGARQEEALKPIRLLYVRACVDGEALMSCAVLPLARRWRFAAEHVATVLISRLLGDPR